jgi:hypothetical protein
MFAAMTRRIRGVCNCEEWKMERDGGSRIPSLITIRFFSTALRRSRYDEFAGTLQLIHGHAYTGQNSFQE